MAAAAARRSAGQACIMARSWPGVLSLAAACLIADGTLATSGFWREVLCAICRLLSLQLPAVAERICAVMHRWPCALCGKQTLW
jgi:hypothetical protein